MMSGWFFNSQRGVGATGGHKQVNFVVVVEHSWRPSCFFPLISLREALLESGANFLSCFWFHPPPASHLPLRLLIFSPLDSIISGSNCRYQYQLSLTPPPSRPTGWNQLMEMRSKQPITDCVAEKWLKLELQLSLCLCPQLRLGELGRPDAAPRHPSLYLMPHQNSSIK